MAQLVLLFAGLVSCIAQIIPEHAQNITVYHVNPKSAGAIPVNMDTGDARGDLFFYLGQFLLPLECANASKEYRAHFDCDNPERMDPNLVVTKVDMQIDARTTKYSLCNLCNGTDPLTHRPCQKGAYTCDCSSRNTSDCDVTRLGNQSVEEQYGPPTTSCSALLDQKCGIVKTSMATCGLCLQLNMKALEAAGCTRGALYGYCPNPYGGCTATSPSWMCWAENIPRKTYGFWYSTRAEGQCTDTSAEGSCGWKIQSTTTVREQCLKEKLMTRVESALPDCFNGCGPRDTNSSCWIGCFFDGVLGEDARHSKSKPVGGLDMAELQTAWESAFVPEAQGGCAPVSVPPSWMVANAASNALVV